MKTDYKLFWNRPGWTAGQITEVLAVDERKQTVAVIVRNPVPELALVPMAFLSAVDENGLALLPGELLTLIDVMTWHRICNTELTMPARKPLLKCDVCGCDEGAYHREHCPRIGKPMLMMPFADPDSKFNEQWAREEVARMIGGPVIALPNGVSLEKLAGLDPETVPLSAAEIELADAPTFVATVLGTPPASLEEQFRGHVTQWVADGAGWPSVIDSANRLLSTLDYLSVTDEHTVKAIPADSDDAFVEYHRAARRLGKVWPNMVLAILDSNGFVPREQRR